MHGVDWYQNAIWHHNIAKCKYGCVIHAVGILWCYMIVLVFH